MELPQLSLILQSERLVVLLRLLCCSFERLPPLSKLLKRRQPRLQSRRVVQKGLPRLRGICKHLILLNPRVLVSLVGVEALPRSLLAQRSHLEGCRRGLAPQRRSDLAMLALRPPGVLPRLCQLRAHLLLRRLGCLDELVLLLHPAVEERDLS